MKQEELNKILEEYKKSDIKAEFKKLEVFIDTFNYDEAKTIGKVVIEVNVDENDFLNSVRTFVSILQNVYAYFSKYERLSTYVRKPSLFINGEEDTFADIVVSDFDSSGFVDLFFRKGLNYNRHFSKECSNVSLKTCMVVKFEIKE